MIHVFKWKKAHGHSLERLVRWTLISLWIWVGLFYVQAGMCSERKVPDRAERGQKQVAEKEMGPLTEIEGDILLSVARNTIARKLNKQETESKADYAESEKFSKKCGTFVTLTIDGNLRGCIGHIIPQESIIEGIKINAINAAFRDPRFKPMVAEEWDRVKIEISILTEPKKLHYRNTDDLLQKLRAGMDGVIIKKGHAQATFLPQVWEQLPKKKDFLAHLCMKAGLEGQAWRKGGLEVFVYQVQAFEEGE